MATRPCAISAATDLLPPVASCVNLRCMPQDTATTTLLQERRLQRGLTLRALAEECARRGVRVGDSQLSKIERGLSIPRPKLRAVLADTFDLDIDLQTDAKADR